MIMGNVSVVNCLWLSKEWVGTRGCCCMGDVPMGPHSRMLGRKGSARPTVPGTAGSLACPPRCLFALWPRLGAWGGLSLLDKLGGCVWVRHDSLD